MYIVVDVLLPSVSGADWRLLTTARFTGRTDKLQPAHQGHVADEEHGQRSGHAMGCPRRELVI